MPRARGLEGLEEHCSVEQRLELEARQLVQLLESARPQATPTKPAAASDASAYFRGTRAKRSAAWASSCSVRWCAPLPLRFRGTRAKRSAAWASSCFVRWCAP